MCHKSIENKGIFKKIRKFKKKSFFMYNNIHEQIWLVINRFTAYNSSLFNITKSEKLFSCTYSWFLLDWGSYDLLLKDLTVSLYQQKTKFKCKVYIHNYLLLAWWDIRYIVINHNKRLHNISWLLPLWFKHKIYVITKLFDKVTCPYIEDIIGCYLPILHGSAL